MNTAPNTPAPALDAGLGRLVLALARLQSENDRLASDLSSTLDVGGLGVRALVVLRLNGDATMSGLGALLRQNPSTVTFLADRLEDRGLAWRRPNPRDRRSLLLSLTDEGSGRADEILQRYGRLFDKADVECDFDRLADGAEAVRAAMMKETA